MCLELFIIFLYFISVNATHLHEIVQVEKNEPGGGGNSPHGLLPVRVQQPQKTPLNV